MRDAHLEVGAGFEDPAEDEGGDHQRVLHDDADAVGHAEAVRALEQQIVLRLRVKEQHGTHALGGLEERSELRLVPGGTVHHRVELGPLEAEDVHRALQLVDRRPDVPQGQRGQARESPGPVARHGGDLVVDVAGELQPLRGLQVIAEERRVNGDHVHVDALQVHVSKPLFRGEA